MNIKCPICNSINTGDYYYCRNCGAVRTDINNNKNYNNRDPHILQKKNSTHYESGSKKQIILTVILVTFITLLLVFAVFQPTITETLFNKQKGTSKTIESGAYSSSVPDDPFIGQWTATYSNGYSAESVNMIWTFTENNTLKTEYTNIQNDYDIPTIAFVKDSNDRTLQVVAVSQADNYYYDNDILLDYQISDETPTIKFLPQYETSLYQNSYVEMGYEILEDGNKIILTYDMIYSSEQYNYYNMSDSNYNYQITLTKIFEENQDPIDEVQSIEPKNVKWSDMEINGDCNTDNLGEYVEAGDIITECYETISIIHSPTSTLIGIFEFDEDQQDPEPEPEPELEPEPEPGVVGYWSFNEGQGNTVYDSSKYENHGTTHGPNWILGILGHALDFDGDNDYVVIPSIPQIVDFSMTQISFTGWVKLNRISGYHSEIFNILEAHVSTTSSTSNELRIETLPNSSKISFLITDIDGIEHFANTLDDLSIDNWHHFACTYDGFEQKIYVDGILVNSSSWIGTFTITTGFKLGRDYEWSAQYLDGMLDEIKIYNYAQDSSEILNEYNQYSNLESEFLYPTDDSYLDMLMPNETRGDQERMNTRNRYGATDDWELNPVIKFDLTEIPTDSIIKSAKLHLYYYYYESTDPADRSLSLYKILEDWNEEDVTWADRPAVSNITTDVAIVPDSFGWITWDVKEDIQDFINGSKENYGWSIIDENYWGTTNIPATNFRSKEYGRLIPYLEIITEQ
jgi:hypothetical protein